MVMDEPTAGQDFANYTRFMDALCSASDDARSILAANFESTLFITHDLDLAVTYANYFASSSKPGTDCKNKKVFTS